MLDDKALSEAIHGTIAKQILEGLDTEARDALLQKAVVGVVKDWKFQSAIGDVAAQKAREIALRLMEAPEWAARVEETIRGAMDDYLAGLRVAAGKAMFQMMHGDSGSYGGCGKVLYHWPKSGDS